MFKREVRKRLKKSRREVCRYQIIAVPLSPPTYTTKQSLFSQASFQWRGPRKKEKKWKLADALALSISICHLRSKPLRPCSRSPYPSHTLSCVGVFVMFITTPGLAHALEPDRSAFWKLQIHFSRSKQGELGLACQKAELRNCWCVKISMDRPTWIPGLLPIEPACCFTDQLLRCSTPFPCIFILAAERWTYRRMMSLFNSKNVFW